ncbi:MAG: hypothetical protein QXH20_01490 [Candidatus Bathyarchaeia archaeon]
MATEDEKYVNILKKLISSSYAFSTGSPDSRDIEENTLAEIRSRLPELKHLDDDELSSLVEDAINYATSKLCTLAEYNTRWGPRKAYIDVERPGYLHEVGWMKCQHPAIGEFHIVFSEESFPDAGTFHYSYLITNNERQAKSEFLDIKRELRERDIV